MTAAQYSPRVVFAGALAALFPGSPQPELEVAVDVLATLGYRKPDHTATLALLREHSFLEESDGDGWNEPRSCRYVCSCKQVEYAIWMKSDPDLTGLAAFQERQPDAMELHHAHVAGILTGTAPEDVPASRFRPVVTDEAIEAAANQLRSQLGDSTGRTP